MDDTTYNGWTNYETWAVNLWLSNDQGSYEYWNEVATEADNKHDLADILESQHYECYNDPDNTYGLKDDISKKDLKQVDWDEVAQHLLEE